MRWLLGVLTYCLAQNLCLLDGAGRNLVQWRLYHLLPYGQNEQLARVVYTLLIEDSVVRHIRYTYQVELRARRMGAWFVMDGQATTEGAYAFFSALQGACGRFPQLLLQLKDLSLDEPVDVWLEAQRRLWRDTMASALPVLAVSEFFYQVWRGGQLSAVVWGGGAALSRVLRQLVYAGDPRGYPWPQEPLRASPVPPQGAAVFYTRWQVSEHSWEGLLALWNVLQALETYLCEKKQLTCQFFYSPTPQSMEVWIYTSIPAATQQAIRQFSVDIRRISADQVAERFARWRREPYQERLLGQWRCLWRLPAAPPISSKQRLSKLMRRLRVVYFIVD